ncbi:hypothetical protein SLA2020_398740 [Shorea laevis]
MAFLHIHPPTLILLLFISLPTATLSQDPSSSSPTIAQCAPSLLPLAPCAPFVQGTPRRPRSRAATTSSSSIPRSHTAFASCSMTPPSTLSLLTTHWLCSCLFFAASKLTSPLFSPPVSQASLGTNTNSTLGTNTNTNTTVAASPMAQVQPRTNIMGSGFGRSSSTKLRGGGDFAVATAMAAFLLTTLLY